MDGKELALELVEKVKELVKKGNVTRIRVVKDGDTVVAFPVTVGVVVGIAAAPWAILLAVVTTLGARCAVEVVKEDGQVIRLS